jgi:hypothetical protein
LVLRRGQAKADRRSHTPRASRRIAFTDWVEGPEPLSRKEAERLLRFMTFPSILDLDDYQQLLRECGCRIDVAEDVTPARGASGRFLDGVVESCQRDEARA